MASWPVEFKLEFLIVQIFRAKLVLQTYPMDIIHTIESIVFHGIQWLSTAISTAMSITISTAISTVMKQTHRSITVPGALSANGHRVERNVSASFYKYV